MDDISNNKSLRALWSTSHLAGGNASYVEQLYESYLTDPNSVDAAWRGYFDTLPQVDGIAVDVPHAPVREFFRRLPRTARTARSHVATSGAAALLDKQVRVLQLINAYRYRGHQFAKLDPLELLNPPDIPDLKLQHYGLAESDYDTKFETGTLVGPKTATLREIIEILDLSYCGTIGAEYMHIPDTAEKRWIQNRIEGTRGRTDYPPETKQYLFERLSAAEGLERYLHTKYAGQKRFSLEGADALIPMLDELIQRGGKVGVREVVIGMAHRGRLNVLVNIMGKTPSELFMEFEGRTAVNGSGDVKYHLGYSSDISTPGGSVHVALAFNPSHLEIVGPVVQGSVRARQERMDDKNGDHVLAVWIHGDAAFAGQGVVMETFNMSQSRGFSTKGTVHIIINNQIGFTTSQQQDSRSTLYCSDVAKMVNAPIFHVNGDDPEAVLFVTQLALDYRTAYRKDVVIDLFCYRRHGHSEADEPSATQPMMYKKIRNKTSPANLYAHRLIDHGILAPQDMDQRAHAYRAALDAGSCVVPNFLPKEQAGYPYGSDWSTYLTERSCREMEETQVTREMIRELAELAARVPDGFELHPNVGKVFDNRRKMAAGAMPIDWGFAETIAYATLLKDGYKVRLSGQDSGRGTFFHRHAIVYSQKDGMAYVPLRHLWPNQPNFLVINSLLSEEAVLAFEYGYATADPKTLTIWEAQFGDFVNNAQVVIDQFISAGEQKWDRLCGLVLFLPHGYEGQGPEHSSARLERFLQLCAEHNMIVCNPTTPAQMFHLLRRQMRWTCRKPLVVMTPKSLLRHRLATSALEEMTQGTFRMVVPEIDELESREVKRVVLCSGKIYYDLLENRRKSERRDVAIVRVEQLYPFPETFLKMALQRYTHATSFVWCQEEPKNQGAWYQSQHHIRAVLPVAAELQYAGRPMSAAPAVGNYSLHVQQTKALVDEALGGAA
jgi:2-oxoglutarate dehydrogenase E1 component